MTFFTVVVSCFILFLILYARYMNANGDISKRRIQLENLRDQVEFRVKKLRKGTDQINKEIGEVSEKIEELKIMLEGPLEDMDDS